MMKHMLIFACLGFLGIGLAFGQILPEDESLTWKGKLKKADRLMEQGSYYNAIDYYKAVLDERPEMADVAIRLGQTLHFARNYKEALQYFKQAFDVDNDKYRIAQYHYAQMLKMNGQYEEAKSNFEDFRRSYRERGPEATALKRLARSEAEGCDLALEMLQDTLIIEITHLGTNVNKLYTEFSPRPVGVDSLLIFGSMVVDSVPVIDKNTKSFPRAKLFKSTWDGSGWSKSRELDGPFNDDKLHTGNGSFSRDGQTFYFTRCSDDDGTNVRCDIYISEYEDGKWSRPKKLGINDNKATNTHPVVVAYNTRGDEMLLFVSDREGGVGGLDIWYSVINTRGDFMEPRNLGRRINTVGDEITPWYDFETEILYFSSNGHSNMGGFDIFKSKGTGRSWAIPINMGYPINSPVDDFYYTHTHDGERGFFVSNRDGSISPKWPNCCDDIWSFEFVYPPVFTIIGQVYEKDDPERIPIDSANVLLILADNNRKIDSSVTADQKGFEFFLGTQFANFRLEARKPGYTYGVNTTSTIGLETSDTLYVDLFLTPIKALGTIVLKNVYFILDDDKITEEAKPSLDTIYDILAANPNIQIELSSHTDSRASFSYNIDLSQRRANNSKAYLVDRGIDPERIVAKGYGESRLVNDCADGVPCSEVEHAVNRRTEFEIIGEIPGTIITYDRSEIEAIQERKRRGTLRGDEDIWQFGDDDPEEDPDF